jgi:hypothetical protein
MVNVAVNDGEAFALYVGPGRTALMYAGTYKGCRRRMRRLPREIRRRCAVVRIMDLQALLRRCCSYMQRI